MTKTLKYGDPVRVGTDSGNWIGRYIGDERDVRVGSTVRVNRGGWWNGDAQVYALTERCKSPGPRPPRRAWVYSLAPRCAPKPKPARQRCCR